MAFLDGCRVLDLTDERGMLAGRMLADLGADVVQVEPPDGSSARRCAPLNDVSGSYFFDAFAANKRGVTADLQTDSGRATGPHPGGNGGHPDRVGRSGCHAAVRPGLARPA